MLPSASIFLSSIVVYFCRSNDPLAMNLKERKLSGNNLKVNRTFYRINKAYGYKASFLSLRNLTSLEPRKEKFFFYRALQDYKFRPKLRRRYLELLNHLNNPPMNWNQKWLNIFDKEGNMRPQYLNTPLGLRAKQLMAQSGDSFISYFFQPLVKLWHLLRPISFSDIAERRFYRNDSETSSQKTSFVDLTRRERSVERGGQTRSEIDLGEEMIDADSTVPHLTRKEDTPLATYVYIPTTYIGIQAITLVTKYYKITWLPH